MERLRNAVEGAKGDEERGDVNRVVHFRSTSGGGTEGFRQI